MFKVETSKAAFKDLKRLPKNVQSFIVSDLLPQLKNFPYQGEKLVGDLKNFSKAEVRAGEIGR